MQTFKASPIGKQEVPDLNIIAVEPIPETDDLQVAAENFNAEGEKICNALYASLPGGTLDALLSSMLKRRASMFRVTFNFGKE